MCQPFYDILRRVASWRLSPSCSIESGDCGAITVVAICLSHFFRLDLAKFVANHETAWLTAMEITLSASSYRPFKTTISTLFVNSARQSRENNQSWLMMSVYCNIAPPPLPMDSAVTGVPLYPSPFDRNLGTNSFCANPRIVVCTGGISSSLADCLSRESCDTRVRSRGYHPRASQRIHHTKRSDTYLPIGPRVPIRLARCLHCGEQYGSALRLPFQERRRALGSLGANHGFDFSSIV